MNYAQMKQTLKDVELIERDLMRDLTEDELMQVYYDQQRSCRI